MENKENVKKTNEVSDEELNNVSGGIIRPTQSTPKRMKTCNKCGVPIPSDKTPCYCEKCLRELTKQGCHQFL